MIKALFIAPSYQQASYWARQWGYKQTEWMYVDEEDPYVLFGFKSPDIPAFAVGNGYLSNETLSQLEIRDVRTYAGEDVR